MESTLTVLSCLGSKHSALQSELSFIVDFLHKSSLQLVEKHTAGMLHVFVKVIF